MTERSPLTHALSDRYEIEREVGAGGMATVYLARDIKHARQVALKVLHPDLAAALGPERFLAEIRTTANLQHPHILPLHDSGTAGGFLFYVMPFVAGESLRQRLERETQLPIDDAVRITREVLSALDYAHRHGIVHRDIKPENILLHDGAALVADFGIALAVQQAGTQRMTQTGLSLGTPHYMSPEQAMGEKNVDGRADVYAAGAVLYEMLTGEPPFTGASVQAIVAKVMTERPMSPRTVRDTVPPYVEAAVLRALAKLPADRFGTAKEFADALDGRGNTGAAEVAARSSYAPSLTRRALPWVGAGALGVLLAWNALLQWRSTHAPAAESVRFTIEPPAGMSIFDGNIERRFALSADGRSLLFIAGPTRILYLRRLNQLTPTALAVVERPSDFQFSPDGESIAYSVRGSSTSLRKVRVGGGEGTSALTLLADSAPPNFAWTNGPDIVYRRASGLWRLPAAGGTPRLAVARDTADGIWTAPVILEDGHTVAFGAQPRGQTGAPGHLRIVSLEGGPIAKVDLEMYNVIGYRDGFLIYGAREGRISGVRFDLKSRTVKGEPVALIDNVESTRSFRGLSAALGANGTLAYMSGVFTNRVDIVDERGAALLTLPLEPRRLMSVKWSPDGGRLLIESGSPGESDLWVYNMTTRVTTRLTRTGNVQAPRWTPDGTRVAFGAFGKLPGATPMWVLADGSTPAEPIAAAVAAGVGTAFDFSFDGRYLLTFPLPQDRRFSTPLIAVPLAGGVPIPMLAGVTHPSAPRTSPDGRWMVYASDEGERRDVYVRPFPSGPGRLQVSKDGGDFPSWSRDGRRIFYRVPGAYRVATVDISGATPRLVRDDSLFADVDRKSFDVHPDGKRFAVIRDAGEGAKLVVVTHWLGEALAKLRHR